MIYILVPTFARVKETKIFLSSINQSIKHDYLTIIIDDHPQKETLKNIEQNNNLNIFGEFPYYESVIAQSTGSGSGHKLSCK